MIIAELTIYFNKEGGYKNMTELNGLIYSDNRFKEFFDRYQKTLKKGIKPRLGLKPLRLSETI